jgi:ferredoxin-NADP reductase
VVGFTSFNLMLAHVVLIVWGYAAGQLARTPATLWELVVGYPGVLLAAGGTAALCMTVVTSLRAARRRLRYESWHLLHLYGYLGAGLALPHQLWSGQDFTSAPGRRVFWWTAWALAAGAVLLWRVGLPVRRNLRHRLRVTSVVPEGQGVVSVYLTGRRLELLGAEAGQFLSFRFLGRRGWTRTNPYSLSAAPDGRSLRVSVQAAGDGSSTLAHLRPGGGVFVEGPYGRLTDRARTRHKVALIGAGVGITPLRALAEGLDYQPGDAVLLQRCRSVPLFTDELATLSAERGLGVLHLPGRRRAAGSWLGAGVGAADDLTALLHWVPDIAERDVYVCGPESWITLVRHTLAAAGLPAERLHLESFAW